MDGPGEAEDERNLVDAFSSGAADSALYTRTAVARLLIAVLRRHGVTAQVHLHLSSSPSLFSLLMPHQTLLIIGVGA